MVWNFTKNKLLRNLQLKTDSAKDVINKILVKS